MTNDTKKPRTKASVKKSNKTCSRSRPNQQTVRVRVASSSRMRRPKTRRGSKGPALKPHIPRQHKPVNFPKRAIEQHPIRTSKRIASKEASALACSIMLPYDGPVVRQRKLQNDIASPSAITRNYQFYTLDYGRLFNTDGANIEPRSGIRSNGQKVWGDLTTYVPFVNTLDYRLLGIVPSRYAAELPVARRISYTATEFLNAEQAGSGMFYIPKEAGPDGSPIGPEKYRMINDGTSILWLDPVDWHPVGAQISEDSDASYGLVHPALDADDGRYVWIDATNGVGDEIDFLRMSNVSCRFEIPNGFFTIPDQLPDTPNETITKFVCQRLSPDGQGNDTEGIGESYFPLQPFVSDGVNTYITYLPIKYSGYYKFGVSGGFVENMATNVELVLRNFRLIYTVSDIINVVSKHIVNPNVVLSSYGKASFMTREQANCASCLVRNTTPVLMKGGMIYAVSPTDADGWDSFTSNFSKITGYGAPSNRLYSDNFEKGCYGWVRQLAGSTFRTAQQTSDYTEGSYFSGYGHGSVGLRSYSISRDQENLNTRLRGMNIFAIVPPGSNPNVAPNNINMNCQLLFTVQYEYTTDSQIPLQQTQMYSNDINEEVMAILSEVNTFTENPLHLRALGNIAKEIGGSISNFYSQHRTAIGGVFTALSAFGGPVASVLGKGLTVLDYLTREPKSFF